MSWPYECLRCLHVWEEDFLLRSLTDVHGNETQIWLRSGVSVQPPWSGSCCPGCGAYDVTSFPSGYLSRHPELIAAPDPEPEPAPLLVPVAEPPGRAPAVERITLPGRLLVAIGAPVALFVGYEFYATVVAPVHHH
ncbi:hypothetical protein MF672_026715 [Actinomadura sp. ATCC 31491]|uniref:Uncharacterized protein n=1 Tax=Actinomadura luzonensis TaxID=2805427 RepID=A0ABT0FYC8_9ACTN|nr:hypothetical protein [Actinomadura luzonensis]MCK2217354.1 hypothetical protein [Actinomadura luzonensis]